MPEALLGLGRIGLAAAAGAGAFPATIAPAEIEPQILRWASTRVQFQNQYSQVLLLAGSNLYRLTLHYVRRRPADLTTFRNFFRAVLGMEGTFPFTHPVEGWTRRMRFARPILAWSLYPPNEFYDFQIELEEAP